MWGPLFEHESLKDRGDSVLGFIVDFIFLKNKFVYILFPKNIKRKINYIYIYIYLLSKLFNYGLCWFDLKGDLVFGLVRNKHGRLVRVHARPLIPETSVF